MVQNWQMSSIPAHLVNMAFQNTISKVIILNVQFKVISGVKQEDALSSLVFKVLVINITSVAKLAERFGKPQGRPCKLYYKSTAKKTKYILLVRTNSRSTPADLTISSSWQSLRPILPYDIQYGGRHLRELLSGAD